ncbi:MAG: RNA polymerase sigma factor [Acidobacteria bacterium]|nr:RNA polymerase sigma factor [Acidobacteriota bacterium]
MGTHMFLLAKDEIALVERCRRQDSGAYDEFCDRFSRAIHRIALRILKDESAAQDAVQETLMNVFRAMARFRGEAKISTWLNRITTNVCLEILRRDKKRKEDSFETVQNFLADSLTHPDSPFDTVYQQELGTRLEYSLQRVSLKQRQVVRMHDLEGFTIKEIAQILNISQGTVKSRLFYGRQECRRHLNRSEKIH